MLSNHYAVAQYRCACFITELDLATADHDITGIPELARCGASGDLHFVSLPSPQSFRMMRRARRADGCWPALTPASGRARRFDRSPGQSARG
ncbi:hypothetical protein MESS2_1670048 [Mesorhizobium metallidurans STM 2683]|uniref:Uncharacterized protein n=2 Tax=Mesorhizobium TaxID=68287 RepID=A0A1R3V4I0_9HYPH|nr:hypothetical protein MESS2_1670048 [Mesorhizobium metallidurans STM 2683]SIT54780.1 conserved hypothetical protein [Mesorhizobium prunaredense]